MLIPGSGSSVCLPTLANFPPDDGSHFSASSHCLVIFNSMLDVLIKRTVEVKWTIYFVLFFQGRHITFPCWEAGVTGDHSDPTMMKLSWADMKPN